MTKIPNDKLSGGEKATDSKCAPHPRGDGPATNINANPPLSVLPTRVGTVHPSRTMFLRTHIGEAENGKLKYELATGTNGQPIVHSLQSDKWFTLTWKDVLGLAVKAGIDA